MSDLVKVVLFIIAVAIIASFSYMIIRIIRKKHNPMLKEPAASKKAKNAAK